MFENKKHVFWQAFFVTLVFFLLGLVLGVYFEQIRGNKFNTEFYQSEVSLYDSLAISNLPNSELFSCAEIKSQTIAFADRIYNEAKNLEQFDSKNQLTDSAKTLHKKYDLLRTLLWMSVINNKAKCGESNTVVYLYTYDSKDLTIKAKQSVWSRVLSDLKEKKGDGVILIPIAIDSNLSSLNALAKKFDVKSYPIVIVNENKAFYDLTPASDIEKYLK